MKASLIRRGVWEMDGYLSLDGCLFSVIWFLNLFGKESLEPANEV